MRNENKTRLTRNLFIKKHFRNWFRYGISNNGAIVEVSVNFPRETETSRKNSIGLFRGRGEMAFRRVSDFSRGTAAHILFIKIDR